MRLFRRSSFGWGPSGAGRANPTRGIAVHYQGGRTGIAGFSHDQCEALWRRNRVHHTQGNGWADIGYSFGVCPHGVLEGRGLGRVQAAQPGGNATWYSVTFLTGPGEEPHPNQIRHFRELRAWLRGKGVARAIRPHSSFVSTACPGDILRRMIRDGTLTRGPTEEDFMAMFDSEREFKDAVFDAVWMTDKLKTDKKKNPFWTGETYITNIERDTDPASIRRAVSQVVEAPLREMSATIATLAADRGQAVDVDALVARIEAAIENVTVRLEVEDEQT